MEISNQIHLVISCIGICFVADKFLMVNKIEYYSGVMFGYEEWALI